MRIRLVLAAALVAALPSVASAGVAPQVGVGSCDVEVTNGTAECIVQLDPNPAGMFAQSTWSGYGTADLYCYVSGRTMHLGGGYGSSYVTWSHSADVCRLRVQASDGTSSAYVD